MADNKLIIQVDFQTGDSKKSFSKIEDNAQKSGVESGKKFSSGFSATAKSGLAGVAKSLVGITVGVRAVGAALRGLSNSFENLKGFSRGVAEINSILPKNNKLTKESTQQLIEFSKSFGTNQQQQAKAFYSIVSAGVKGTSRQLETLAVSNRAAVAGLVNIDTASKAIVSSVNAYAKSGLTAQQASDALFVAVREGQTTFGELADFLGNATSIAANAGVQFNELAGALAFVTKSGISTDVATTGLRQVFASVISPTKEAADEALKLGIAFNSAGLRAKGLAGFLKDVQDRTGGNEESLSKLFGNIRALAPILNIVNGNFKDFSRILNETKNATGATSSAFDEIKSNLDFKFDQVSSQWQAFGLNLLKVVSPAIRETAESLTFLGKIFNSVFKVESTKPLDVINKKMGETASQLNSLRDSLKSREAGFFGFKTDYDILQIEKLKGQITALENKRKEQLVERANILEARRSLAEQEKNIAQDVADSEVRNKVDVLAKLKELGVQTNEAIIGNMFERMATLTTLREQNLIDQQTYSSAQLQIASSTNAQLMALEEQRLQNSSVSIANIGDSFKLLAKQARANSLDIAKTVNNVMAKGVGNAFAKVGTAMKKGKSEWDAFKSGIQQMAGEIASSLGDLYIKWGIANIASQNYAVGAAQLAGGGALKILGGMLGSGGGSSSGGDSGGAVSGATGGIDTTGLEDQQEAERNAPQTNVEVVVQGSLVQQEELGTFIAETLSDSFGKQGVALTDARLA